MNYLLSLLAGILQGLTEFLPVSSSGHLVLFHDVLKFGLPSDVLFDATLHLGTLFALLFFFRADIVRVLRGLASSLRRWNVREDADQRLGWLVVIGAVPIGIAGVAFAGVIERTLRHPAVVAAALIGVGVLFFIAERFAARTKTVADMSAADAGTIGVAQVLALVPGVSRSGFTIVAGLARKLRRGEAARFSFLISIPAFIGAEVLELAKADWSNAGWGLLAVGYAAALASGVLTIRFFLKFLERHPLHVFAWYRIALGLVVIAWLIFAK